MFFRLTQKLAHRFSTRIFPHTEIALSINNGILTLCIFRLSIKMPRHVKKNSDLSMPNAKPPRSMRLRKLRRKTERQAEVIRQTEDGR